jgi:hypothetical protein
LLEGRFCRGLNPFNPFISGTLYDVSVNKNNQQT